MRVTLVYNAAAGDERLTADDLVRAIAQAGHRVRVYTNDAADIRRAVEDPGELIAVAGGDGTVKRVARRLAGRDVPMTILPIGTANNIAKTLGCIGTTHDLIAGWRGARAQPLDLGIVAGDGVEQAFLESVGAGLIARLIDIGTEAVDESPSALTGNEIDRALILLGKILRTHRPQRWRLSLDGRDLTGEYNAIEAMNTRFVGPNIPVAPGADPADGLLDVVLIGERDREPLLWYLSDRLHGTGRFPALTVHRGACFTLALPEDEDTVHVDDRLWSALACPGDPARPGARGEITARLRPGALLVLAPAAAP